MLEKIGESFKNAANALTLRARRQEVLTSNISNVDTPNYKAVDFDFKKALESLNAKGTPSASTNGLASSSSSLPSLNESASDSTQYQGGLAVTHQGHLAGSGSLSGGLSTEAMLKFRRGNTASLDNNSVDIDRERAAFAENSVKYEAALREINGRIATMKQAMGSN